MRIVGAALLLLAGTCAFPAAAEYPDKPIRLIVPQAAGSATDTVARILGAELGKELGQQIIVDNRPGGALTIGLDLTAKSEPDGYTICMGPIGALAITRHMVAKLPYDIERDFQPIALVARGHMLLAVAPDAPFKTVPELIDYARKNPGKLSNASSSNGSPGHVGGELFKSITGVQATIVPYKGTAQLMNDLLGGHVPMAFGVLPPAMGNLAAGTLRGIAMLDKQRFSLLPNVPTSHESGLPGFESVLHYGLLGPTNLPRPIVDKLNAAMKSVAMTDEVKKRINNEGGDPLTSTPDEYAADIDQEERKWAALIKKLNLKVE